MFEIQTKKRNPFSPKCMNCICRRKPKPLSFQMFEDFKMKSEKCGKFVKLFNGNEKRLVCLVCLVYLGIGRWAEAS